MGNGCRCGARGGGGWGNLLARAVSQLAPVPTLESACLTLAAFPPPLTFHVGETRRCGVGRAECRGSTQAWDSDPLGSHVSALATRLMAASLEQVSYFLSLRLLAWKVGIKQKFWRLCVR